MSIFDCPLYSPRTPEGGILQDPRGQKGAAMLKEGVSRRVQGGQRNRKEVRTQTTWVQGKWAEQRARQPYRQSQQALGNLLWKEGLGWEKVNGRAVHCPLPRRALPSTPVLHWHSPLQGCHQCLLWLPADPPLTSDLSRRGPVCASIFTTTPLLTSLTQLHIPVPFFPYTSATLAYLVPSAKSDLDLIINACSALKALPPVFAWWTSVDDSTSWPSCPLEFRDTKGMVSLIPNIL